MSGKTSQSRLIPALIALLRGVDLSWPTIGAGTEEWLNVCEGEGVTSLMYRRMRLLPPHAGWPVELLARLGLLARAETAAELVRRTEVTRVLEALAVEGVQPILVKGTALAYTVYDAPSLRSRHDSDLLMRAGDIERVRRTMKQLGYAAPAYCADLFGQFEYARRDKWGVIHAFDFHWTISTQAAFAQALVYDDIVTSTVPIPLLGSAARAADAVHALLLACIHAPMHHRNVERLIWVYDVHLLASSLSPNQLEDFVREAVAQRVSQVCAHQLALARARFHTSVPEWAMSVLAAPCLSEPSAQYLLAGRRWHHELVSNLQQIKSWRGRVRLLRHMVLPDRRYMLDSYGVRGRALGTTLLPALYVFRVCVGVLKIVVGRK